MNMIKKITIKKIGLALLWTGIATACTILLVAAIQKRNTSACKGIEVEISGVNNNFFIDKQDIIRIIQKHTGNTLTGRPMDAFNLVAIEEALEKEIWINSAELFFNNQDMLQVNVHEREPVARVFTSGGNSFYLDSTLMMLPLSDRLSARVPVFTNFPAETKVLSKADSSLLQDISTMSLLIQRDSFLMAMIDQVAINGRRQFEMVPKIGDQLIVFGDAKNAAHKFDKLRLFYKKVIPVYGWGRYSVISLQYNGQVVAKIKGKEDVAEDSLRTIQIMQATAAYTKRMAGDSSQNILPENEKNATDISIILQSLQRDDEAREDDAIPVPVQVADPVSPKTVSKPVVAPVKKPVVSNAKTNTVSNKVTPAVKPKPAKATPVKAKPPAAKPKIVMPPKNEY